MELYQHWENDVALEYETDKSIKWPVGGGLQIVNNLLAHFKKFDNSEILYETEAVKLSISDEGRVNGVVVRGKDGLLRTLSSKAVVIASGGFEGNPPEMLTQYLATTPSTLSQSFQGCTATRVPVSAWPWTLGPTQLDSSTCSTRR